MLEVRRAALYAMSPEKRRKTVVEAGDMQRRIEEDRERHKRLRERAWILPATAYTSQSLFGTRPEQLDPTYLTRTQTASPRAERDDVDGDRVWTTQDLDFSHMWEETSDFNDDDIEAIQEDLKLSWANQPPPTQPTPQPPIHPSRAQERFSASRPPENPLQCGIPNARPSPTPPPPPLTALHIVPPPFTIIAFCVRCIASATASSHRGPNLLPEVLSHVMQPVKDGAEVAGLVEQALELLDRIVLAQVQQELVLHLEHRLIRLQPDIRDVGIHHERHQVQNQVGVLAQIRKRRVTECLEACIVRTLRSAHRIHHLLAHLDRRRERLRIAAENVAKVDVEKVTVRREEQVVQMPIAHAKQIGDNAVSRARADKRLKDTGVHTKGRQRRGLRMVRTEKVEQRPLMCR